jgi:hypothetical protein
MVGDVVTTSFANGNSVEATIVGTFADRSLIGQDFVFDTSEYVSANVETAEQFRDRIEGDIDQVLAIVNMMVALAAWLPARRAGRLDVLEAIAAQ